MSPINENKNKNIGVFTLISQPPHFGELLAVMQVIDKFDILIICIKAPARLISIRQVQQMWSMALKKYKDKVIIATSKENFAEIAILPSAFVNTTILTMSKTVFAHLMSLGIKSELVGRVKGYHDIFQRVAYRQGCALDWITEGYGTKR